MPIAVRVVSEQEFATWVGAKKKFADDNAARPTSLAAGRPRSGTTSRRRTAPTKTTSKDDNDG